MCIEEGERSGKGERGKGKQLKDGITSDATKVRNEPRSCFSGDHSTLGEAIPSELRRLVQDGRSSLRSG
jgi:hypothetical protein